MSAVNRMLAEPQPERVERPTFDEGHFSRQTFGDPDLQREIVQLFLAQVNDARHAFSRPMTTTAWRFLTHTLKGAAASVGAARMADMASEWELAGSPQDPRLRQQIVAAFEAEADAFGTAVRPYCE